MEPSKQTVNPAALSEGSNETTDPGAKVQNDHKRLAQAIAARSPKKLLFAAITLMLVLGLSEAALRIATAFSPKLDQVISHRFPPIQVPDETLGFRPNPEFRGHDTSGFRNPVALSSARIVALGDSQTYGMGVKPQEAWPHQLGYLSGETIYSMSFGGYGSVRGLLLMRTKALQLGPKLVIFALYDGNDLWDAYDAVHRLGLCDPLKSTDPATLETIAALEQEDPLLARIQNLSARMGLTEPLQQNAQTLPGRIKLVQLLCCLERIIQARTGSTREQRFTALAQSSNTDPELFEVFDFPPFRTIFTPAYRDVALDLGDPRIAEGLRITLAALREMQQTANEHSIDFLVLLIPCKERVFYELLPKKDFAPSQSLQEMISHEDQVRKITLDYLQQHGIAYIDSLPILKDCLDRHEQPFFQDDDGHLNAVGHEAIANRLQEYIHNTYDWD